MTRKHAHRLAKEDFIARTHDALDRGSYFDALLAFLEYKFQYNEDMPGEAERRLLPHIKSDPRLELCLLLSLGSAPRDKAQIIPLLDSIQRNNLDHGHIIDLLKANELAGQGQWRQAEEPYLKALRGNPYLPDVYQGLARIYHQTGREVHAWKCWDLLTRRVAIL